MSEREVGRERETEGENEVVHENNDDSTGSLSTVTRQPSDGREGDMKLAYYPSFHRQVRGGVVCSHNPTNKT